jgi:hypothetical protein
MRWTDKHCETGPISGWTWLGLGVIVFLCLFAAPIIESLPW